jgi:hypothetical protein
VLGEKLGSRVRKLELVGTERGWCYWDNRVKNTRFRLAIIAMAGTIAERKWHRLRHKLISSGDFFKIRRHGFDGVNLEPLDLLTCMYVGLWSKQIERVARELVKRDLTGDEVRALIKRRSR